MGKYSWISLRAIVDDYNALTNHAELNGEDGSDLMIRFGSDGASRILGSDVYDQRVISIPIENYKGELPRGFKQIVQVGCIAEPTHTRLRDSIVEWNQNILGSECNLDIKLNCPECEKSPIPPVIVDINRIYTDSHPEMYTQHAKHFYGFAGYTHRGGARSIYHPQFELMKPAQGSFFNSKYHIPGCLNLRMDHAWEYKLEPPAITVNFEKGLVLLSYLSIPLDEDGLPLIPDVPIAFEAISAYITEKMMFQRFYKTGNPNDRVNYQLAVQERERLISRAKTELFMPSFDEMWRHIQNHHRKTLPYYNWESNLNRFQKDQYNFPSI